MNPIRVLALDGHGVVYYRNREVPEAVVDALHRAGKLAVPREVALARYLALQDRVFSRELEYREMLREFVREVGWDSPSAPEELHRLIQKYSADIVVDPDLVPTLEALRRKGIKVGMLTNSIHPAATKLSWLREKGVAQLFDLIFSSVEAGAKKPAPEIFRSFARTMGVPPEEVVFVGHDPAEVQGAKRAGLRTVCLRCRCAEADYTIDRLNQLLSLPCWPSAAGGSKGER